MTAKTYLSQIRHYDLLIRQCREELADMQARAYGNSSPRLDPDKVQTSGSGDAMARQIETCVALEQKVRRLETEYWQIRNKIFEEIQKLPNDKHIELLNLRYVKCMRMEEIACTMRKTNGDRYSYDHIWHMHLDALKSFERVHRFKFL